MINVRRSNVQESVYTEITTCVGVEILYLCPLCKIIFVRVRRVKCRRS
jgi:hypothetical protein